MAVACSRWDISDQYSLSVDPSAPGASPRARRLRDRQLWSWKSLTST